MAEHLLSLGHERIAVVLTDESYSLSQYARGYAMVEHIRSAGRTAVIWGVPSDRQATEVLTERLGGAGITERLGGAGITAVMCPTDQAAVEALEVLRQRGQSAPQHFTVTGYDGYAPLDTPFLGLTTFRQPVQEIGRTAIDLLLDRIEGKTDQDRLVELRGSLIEGRTAGRVSALS